MTLDEFNQLDAAQAYTLLHEICHCQHWAEQMVTQRPYSSVLQLLTNADHVWASLGETELLEACGGHARIGDTKAIAATATGRAAVEQGQVASAELSVLEELKLLNNAYLEKFGFIYLVCASGKSAAQLLALLKARLSNSREEELINAALEQAQITELRLRKLLSDVL